MSRFVEVGPDSALVGSILESCVGEVEAVGLMRQGRPEPETVVNALARLWVRGVEVDWKAFFAPTGAKMVELPTYAFQRRSFWPEAAVATPGDVTAAGLTDAGHPLLGAAVTLADGGGHLFTSRLSLRDHSWLSDHDVLGTILFPGTGFLELALRAAAEVGCDQVEELTLAAPLVMPENGAVQLQVTVGGDDGSGLRAIRIHSRAEGASGDVPWTLHATGSLGRAPASEEPTDLSVWPPADAEVLDVSGFYDMYLQGGFTYGPTFQGLRQAWRVGEEVFAEISLPAEYQAEIARYGLHPPLLDAAVQALTFVALDGSGQSRLPFSWSGVSLYSPGASTLRVRLAQSGPDSLSMSLADGAGRPVATVGSLAMRQVSAAQLRTADSEPPRSMFQLDWAEVPTDGTGADTSGWAVLGEDTLGLAAPLGAGQLTDLQAVEQDAVPEVVLVPCYGGLTEDASAEAVAGRARELSHGVLALLQQWLADSRFGRSLLVFVTRGAVASQEEGAPSDPAASTVWGLVRSAQSEEPGRFLLVDVDDGERATLLPGVLDADEPQLAIRDGVVRAARLGRLGGEESLLPPADTPAWRLDTSARGSLANLALVPDPELLEPLQPEQVRVSVRAAGLNFRDVLNALDMYPGDPGPMGVEGAGVITEVGSAVTDFAPGDRVLGMFGKAFGPVSLADHRMIARMPDDWSFDQAASAPVVFLTAYYGLVELAQLRAGESVLIHAAAGGVGMAATQIARHLGAEVFGTASAPKQDALRGLGLADDHIASSRDLDFEERFRRVAEDGRVDVVLNALAGEYVNASLRLLSDGGRFLEMGKTDVRTPEDVQRDHPGVSYQAFDLVEAGAEHIGRMLVEVLRLIEQGALSPLPTRTWDIRRAPEAYRYVQQARHIGKVVLTMPKPLDPEGTVLVTGGTGGLGRYLARHLVEQHGIRHLLLTSRRGEAAEGAAALRSELAELGATVRIDACDAADREALRATLDGVPAEHPLTGVVHVAGVVDDGVLSALDPERMDTTLRPKVDAALNLYELTQEADLSVFALFSGAAGTLGGAGQGNYAAANAFVDEFARWVRGRGVPAVALAWGPWVADRGMTGHLTETDFARMAQAGLRPLSEQQGMELFDYALLADRPAVLPMRLDANAAASGDGPVPSLMRALVSPATRRTATTAAPSAEPQTEDLGRTLRQIPAADRLDHLVDLVCAQAAAVLGYASADEIDPEQAFNDAGFDSLTAIELRNRMNSLTGTRLPATLIFDYPAPVALAEHLLEALAPDEAEEPASPTTEGGERTEGSPLDEIERLDQLLGRLASGSGEVDGAVGRRLQALAAKWSATTTATAPVADSEDEDDELESATADELFKLIDGEFGGTS
ncbi:SDR family NAD(P)-dependent oxidoreductase [Streptomyces sp. NPDC005438]|uniref:SDR family NAD(P)-dependent oxidoreductase n=1 Tax=Streptomyces sp. NPDC005438 TaxID=3156880 RepID=UPI0033B545ED